jgi:hypothetical protein
MNATSAGSLVQKWTWTRWLAIVAIVFLGHVLLIFIFGAHKPILPAPVKNIPVLTLAVESSKDWVGLKNAILYALPARSGFAGEMWTMIPPLSIRTPDMTEDPHWLGVTDPLQAQRLGSDFRHFVQTNHSASVPMEFNLPPVLAAPTVPAQPQFAQGSTLEMSGEIAKRGLLDPMKLPSWPTADPIAPSVVQVVVNAEGRVVSAVLLPSDNYSGTPYLEATPVRDSDADQYAIGLARSARFAPLASGADSVESGPVTHLSVGRLIFTWQAAPLKKTNAQP